MAEKYRPKTFDEMVGQERAKKVLMQIAGDVKSGRRDLPHMLFMGPPGVGKTTAAYVLAREIGWDIVEFNASHERGVQAIREKIAPLSRVPRRIIILLDEADALTEDAQYTLRRIIETAPRARFILTANYPDRLIQAIRSRLVPIAFDPLPVEDVVKRLLEILVREGVDVKKHKREVVEALRYIYRVSRGDMRQALNLLEAVLTSTGGVSLAAVRALVGADAARRIVDLAVRGRLDEALEYAEKEIASRSANTVLLYEQLYRAVSGLPPLARAKAVTGIVEAYELLMRGGSPLLSIGYAVSRIYLASLEARVLGEKSGHHDGDGGDE